MATSISRMTTAFVLAASIGVGGIAPVSVHAAQGQQSAQAQKKEDSQKRDAKQEIASATNATRPLKVNEDPRMIGKRNINNGTIFTRGGSVEGEVRTGQRVAAEVDKQVKLIDDPVITEYVNRVGQNIVLHSDAKVPFTIKVIDSDEVNAFALPGGFFYVNKGLILAADNEAEVAGVMAHEIAHVAARHAVEMQRKGTWINYGLLAGAILLGGGLGGAILQNTAGLGLGATFAKFSRGAEEEADRLGVQYMYAAGYDPNAMSTMFEKLSSQNKKKPGFFAKTFATHPQSIDRLEASRSLVARFPEREEYVLSTSEFQRVKNRLLRMSNARASSTGDISGGDGTPGRPTLKRRQPPTDDSTTTTTNEPKQDDRPTLRRRDAPPPPPVTNP